MYSVILITAICSVILITAMYSVILITAICNVILITAIYFEGVGRLILEIKGVRAAEKFGGH
jgi:hypothetical protein